MTRPIWNKKNLCALFILVTLPCIYSHADERFHENFHENYHSDVENQMRDLEFCVSPLALAYGIPGMEVDVGVTRNLTFGVLVQTYRTSSKTRTLQAYEVNLGTTFYLAGHTRFTDSFVLQPFFDYVEDETDTETSGRQVYQKGIYFSLMGGYEWFWKNGFSVQVGAGAFAGLNDTSQRNLEPQLSWQIGWAI